MEAAKQYTATRNACKLCSPLGASIAFKGIEGCVPLIHGSQGCATYIRRYLISHYKEPVDIASTNFTEESAVFGGEKNLFSAIDNVNLKYNPSIIGIATTCLSETIGDDLNKLIEEYRQVHKNEPGIPELVHVNTPSFKGTHADAFHEAILKLTQKYAAFSGNTNKINLFPGFLSPADIRYLRGVMEDLGLGINLLPDFSETLDYEYTGEYEKIPSGGTPLADIRGTGSARASIELGYVLNRSSAKSMTAGQFLEEQFSIPRLNLGIPIGINETDAFFDSLSNLGAKIPARYNKERGRLVDAYVDGHKYVFGKRVVIYGEEDFVVSMSSFLDEIGMDVVLCASGGRSGHMKQLILEKTSQENKPEVLENADFEDIATACKELNPDILVGNSKGYYIARQLGIPLVRAGFPIHDRLGGQRIRTLGYSGTLELFDRIANALIKQMQDNSPVGYKYI